MKEQEQEQQSQQQAVNYSQEGAASQQKGNRKPNKTGIPDRLKAVIEHFSGLSLDEVRVHYNSEKPGEIGALAYAEYPNIYIAAGEEKHLAHEVWHIVQQMQGRVKATTEVEGKKVNDSEQLEKEADKDIDQQTISGKNPKKLKKGIIQGRWRRVPTDLAMQEKAEVESIAKLATGGEYINAFKMHTTTEPSVASEFYKIYIALSKNSDLVKLVDSILKNTYEGGQIASSDVLQHIINSLPLDQGSSVEAFSESMTKANVAEASNDKKMAVLQKVIDDKFQALNIPPLKIILFDGDGGRSGEFDSTSWSFSITPEQLAKPISEWTATAYHESRHAEQYFLMARLIVKEGIEPPHSKQIPDIVLEKAAQMPALEGGEKEKAELFYNSIFGDNSEHRATTLKKLGVYTLAAVGQALQEYKLSQTDYLQKHAICKGYAEKNKQNALDAGQTWPDATQEKNISTYNLAKEIFLVRKDKFLQTAEKQKESYKDYVNLPEEKEAHMLGDWVKKAMQPLALVEDS